MTFDAFGKYLVRENATKFPGKLLMAILIRMLTLNRAFLLTTVLPLLFRSSIRLRQEDNLSPILFVLNENDINIYIKLFVLLYAGDTVLMSEDQESTQNLLNDFSDYCRLWKFQINMNKTKVMVFGTNKPEKVLSGCNYS